MIDKKTWQEFRDTGLLLIINQFLHIFGWAIVVDYKEYDKNIDSGIVKEVYPARVKFRGFDEKSTEESYIKISKYMNENSEKLLRESQE